MKFIIIIMTTCLMQVSAAGFAQKITFSKRGATLEQIFTEIRKQTGYYVVYAENKVDKQARLDVNFRNTELKSVLDVISDSQDLEYSFDERNISLKPKGLLDNIIARFQAIDVEGRVTDSLGNGIPGVTISVKNGKRGTQTDANGRFLLKNVEDGSVLVFNYLGYKSKEIPVSKYMPVELQQSTSKLDEVQVMAYGKTSRRLSTGSITTIKAEDIQKQTVDNPLYALMGRIPGLTITPESGMPGSTVKVQLRGQNSLAGLQTEPLIVIDGVPFANNIPGFGSGGGFSALSIIDPSTIESIDVLKDADATSIYGSRGGNGVILITTKKGKSGAPTLNVDVSQGYSKVPHGSKLKLMNTEQYLAMRREAFTNDGAIPTNDPNDFEPGHVYAPDLTLWSQSKYTDWQEVFQGKTASFTNLQGSYSGGGNNVQYLLSGSYRKQGYVYPGESKWEDGGMQFNIGGNSNNQKFRVNLTGVYRVNSQLAPSVQSGSINLAPNAPDLYTATGEFNWELNPITGEPTWNNPIANSINSNRTNATTINMSTDLSYAITNNVTFKTNVGFSDVRTNSVLLNKIASQPPNTINPFGRSVFINTSSKSWTVDPQLSYSGFIGKGKMDMLLVANLQSQNIDRIGTTAEGFTDDALLEDLKSALNYIVENSKSQYKYTGTSARISYNWADRYLFNFNLRRDGSSRFGPGYQFGNFWSVGSAWIFSNENFFQRAVPFVSFGKIRGSYGSSGNDAIPDYAFLEYYNTYPDRYYQGIKPVYSNGASNQDYRWEDTRKLELALDLGLLQDRVLISASYWKTVCADQLGTLTLPYTAGGDAIIANQNAKIQNDGAEFSLNTKNIVGKHFKWETSFNLGIQRNKILSLPDEFDGTLVTALRYYKENSIDPIGKPFSGFASVSEYRGVDPITGLYRFSDKDGNITSTQFEVNQFAKKIDLQPKYSGGLGNTISYGNVSFDFFFQFIKQMGKTGITPVFMTPGFASANQPLFVLDRWKEEGDIKNIQKYSQADSQVIDGTLTKFGSDAAFMDASFLRLKTISLRYSLPDVFTKKMKFAKTSIALQGQNLWTLTNYKFGDPEVQNGLSLPVLRYLTLGLSFTF